MLDIKLIRKDPKKYAAKLQEKEPDLDLAPVLELDEKLRQLKTEVEQLKADRNEQSKKVGELKKANEPVNELMQSVRMLGEKITALDHQIASTEAQFTDALSRLPNLAMEDVKVSQDVADNVIIKQMGEKRSFDFTPKNHLELNELHHLFEFQRTAKTTGTGWPAYKGMGARLEWALINYMIEIQQLNGFEFWLPPLMVRPPIMFGSGQIPKFDGQYYEVGEDEHKLYMIPTAEVVLNGLHYDEILPAEQLPLKYSAFTPCFRKEAGAAGAQERGLIRIHQFHKVEMFCFTHPDQSAQVYQEMLGVAEEILQGLGLHYRLAELVTGDMSFTAAKTIDVEVWLPGQNRYYEVSSISHCTDYQARRSHIRYREKGGKPELVHTLNGSGLATPRLLVALLENNQNADGSINLPPVLAERLGTHILQPS
ncbi:MAG: Serine--tRNA ligase [Chlamydiales bacterium]|nr:Serine--tRNA ligase [Chlamydiales bacterium]